MGKEKIEVQDIIKKYGKEYKENHKIMETGTVTVSTKNIKNIH